MLLAKRNRPGSELAQNEGLAVIGNIGKKIPLVEESNWVTILKSVSTN